MNLVHCGFEKRIVRFSLSRTRDPGLERNKALAMTIPVIVEHMKSVIRGLRFAASWKRRVTGRLSLTIHLFAKYARPSRGEGCSLTFFLSELDIPVLICQIPSRTARY